MNDSDKKNLALIRDPNLAKNRIFVGNLPSCTREELRSICQPYAKVLASLVHKNFGFVQFESEEISDRVARALNKSTFKGNKILVRNANWKKNQQQQQQQQLQNIETIDLVGPTAPRPVLTPAIRTTTFVEGSDSNTPYNDCEIIVVDRKNTKYAEILEDRLKRLNLRVDVLFPNEDVPLGKVLSNIAFRGCSYAILVTNQHEEHNSITVNILYGQPAEHRNMPMEDAIKLIGDDFRKKLLKDKPPAAVSASQVPPIPVIPVVSHFIAPPLKERHPDAVQALLNLLANNMPLTVLQYDKIIQYIQDRRRLQLKAELGDNAEETVRTVADPEIEMQKKILNILRKPSVTQTQYELMYHTLDQVKRDSKMLGLLRDIRVQNALDMLMDTNLVTTVENLMQF